MREREREERVTEEHNKHQGRRESPEEHNKHQIFERDRVCDIFLGIQDNASYPP